MFNGKVIDSLLKVKGLTRADLVFAVWGKPESNRNHRSVSYFLKRKNITTDKLEALSTFLHVPMEVFFLEDETTLPEVLARLHRDTSLTQLRQKISQLQSTISDKDKLINSLEEQIALLKQLNISH